VDAASGLPPVLNRMLALWNGGGVDAASVYARGCVENGGEEVFDPEAIPPLVEALRTAAPDLSFEVLDWFAAESRYVIRLRASGTHDGPFPTKIGIAEATGRKFAMHGIEVFESTAI
jgi:SnoaL-like polyketide cyclase